jgi:hypothetical protein
MRYLISLEMISLIRYLIILEEKLTSLIRHLVSLKMISLMRHLIILEAKLRIIYLFRPR